MTCDLENWYATDEGICRNFMYFFVEILIGELHHLTVYDSNLDTAEYDFDSFSEAVYFANKYVSRSFTLDEVRSYHKEMVLKIGGF